MIKCYNNISLAAGIPGIILQIAGNVMRVNSGKYFPGAAVIALGTVLLLVGLAYYAKAKGHHPAWCLLAFLSLIGFIVLGLLPDRIPDGKIKGKKASKRDADDDDEDTSDGAGDDREDEQPRKRRSAPSNLREPVDEEPNPRNVPASEAIMAQSAPASHRLMQCVKCRKSLKIPASFAGKKVKCPACGEVFAA